MKTAKKILAVMLAALMMLAFVACTDTKSEDKNETSTKSEETSTADTGDALDVVKDGKITMVTNAEFEPFEYREGNDIVGIDIDISKKIAEKLGAELEVTDIAFDSCIPSVQSGKADFSAAGLTVSESRLKSVDFTDNYFNASQSIIVAVDSEITGREDLNGKIVGVQQGTTSDIYCTNEDGESDVEVEEVKRYNRSMDAVADLINGRIDAVVVDDYPAEKLVEKNADKVKKLDEALTEEEYAIAVPKGSKLKDLINEVIKELKESGEMDEIISKYISE